MLDMKQNVHRGSTCHSSKLDITTQTPIHTVGIPRRARPSHTLYGDEGESRADVDESTKRAVELKTPHTGE